MLVVKCQGLTERSMGLENQYFAATMATFFLSDKNHEWLPNLRGNFDEKQNTGSLKHVFLTAAREENVNRNNIMEKLDNILPGDKN